MLDSLRQPLEAKRITISRASYNTELPADFLLVAAMNPCPCGYFGHPVRKCTCSLQAIQRYLRKISGPFLDRIDLQIKVQPAEAKHLHPADNTPEQSAVIAARVAACCELQTQDKARPMARSMAKPSIIFVLYVLPNKKVFYRPVRNTSCPPVPITAYSKLHVPSQISQPKKISPCRISPKPFRCDALNRTIFSEFPFHGVLRSPHRHHSACNRTQNKSGKHSRLLSAPPHS